MKFGEIIQHIKDGKWVRRTAWHHEYAIHRVNDDHIYLMSTANLFYWIGDNSPPLVNEDFHRAPHRSNDGLQSDVFCNDWEIAKPQKKYDGILVRSKMGGERRSERCEEERIRQLDLVRGNPLEDLEKSRDLWNRRLNVERPYPPGDPVCECCEFDSCDKCMAEDLDPYQDFIDAFNTWRFSKWSEKNA